MSRLHEADKDAGAEDAWSEGLCYGCAGREEGVEYGDYSCYGDDWVGDYNRCGVSE